MKYKKNKNYKKTKKINSLLKKIARYESLVKKYKNEIEKIESNTRLHCEIISLDNIQRSNSQFATTKFQKKYKKYSRCRICRSIFNKVDSYTASYCKSCHQLERKKNYERNKTRTIEMNTEWSKLNKDKTRIYRKTWRNNNKDKIKAYTKSSRVSAAKYRKKIYHTSPIGRLKTLLRSRLRKALKVKKWHKKSSFADYIGIDFDGLKIHLEQQFKDGMNWNNHGSYWQIDHVVPLASAKTEAEIYELCHYTNLQPLSIEEHKEKSVYDRFNISIHKQS